MTGFLTKVQSRPVSGRSQVTQHRTVTLSDHVIFAAPCDTALIRRTVRDSQRSIPITLQKSPCVYRFAPGCSQRTYNRETVEIELRADGVMLLVRDTDITLIDAPDHFHK